VSVDLDLPPAPPPAAPPPAAPPSAGVPWFQRIRARTVINTIAIVVMLYLVLGPLIVLFVSAFEDTSRGIVLRPPFPWTGQNLADVFGSGHTYSVLWTTLLFCAGGLLVAFVVSLVIAYLVERTDLPARNSIFVLVVAPQGMPALISAIAWSLLLNPTNGFVNVLIHTVFGTRGRGPLNVYSLPWMILVQGMSMVPLTFLLITASLRGMNGSLEDAARTSGGGFGHILRKVTLPLLRPAIIGALVYEFVTIVETVDVPLVLGLPGRVTVLSTQIYTSSHPASGLPNYGVGSTYGIVLLLLALLPLLFYNRLVSSSGSSYVTVTGKTFRPRVQPLGRWRIWAAVFCWLYITVSLFLPLLILIWASIQPYLGALNAAALKRITLKSWGSTLSGSEFLTSLLHTLVVGVVTAAASMVLAMLLSWIIVRSHSRWRWVADLLAFLPHAIPGVVIGLSTLIIYLVLPVGVYGTIWIIVIAMATQFVSLGSRLTTSGIAQIQRTLEEAAEASGAKQRHIWMRVLFPLLRPVFFNGFLMVFLASIQNLTLPLMLQSSGNEVLSTLIWSRWDYGDATGTAVLSVLMTAITIAAALLLRRAGGRRLAA
jgi:iron(III) transport system permease protein